MHPHEENTCPESELENWVVDIAVVRITCPPLNSMHGFSTDHVLSVSRQQQYTAGGDCEFDGDEQG
jgi:hypothetical protein